MSLQYSPKYEDLYNAGGLDSSNVRRGAWKLERLGVLPQYRNKGVGRALLNVLIGRVSHVRMLVTAEYAA